MGSPLGVVDAPRDRLVSGPGPDAGQDRAAEDAKEELGAREGQVEEHYREMTDKGAHVKGEGQIP